MTLYRRIRVSTALSTSGLPDLDYAFNPYAGCYHSCIYCYARGYTRYSEVANNWGKVIYIKENIIDLLRKEVKAKKTGVVGVSTITDPYQPIEVEEKLTREALAILLDSGFKISIQTKSDLVLRDIDVITLCPDSVDVGVTITTVDEEVARIIEPNAPLPKRRIKAVERISSEGIETWVFLGPIIYGVNDSVESLKGVVEVASYTGSTLYYDFLRMKPAIYNSIKSIGGKAQSIIKFSKDLRWRKNVLRTLEELCSREGVVCKPGLYDEKKKCSISLDYFLEME